MKLLPPSPDTCAACAVKHDATHPHNAQSLYYQYRFYGKYGRWPTWADALAHCTPSMRDAWISALRSRGAYSEPPAGVAPIADHPADVCRELVAVSNVSEVVTILPPDEKA